MKITKVRDILNRAENHEAGTFTHQLLCELCNALLEHPDIDKTYEIRVNQRTDEEIDALFDECVDGQQDRFIGKTYEAGIAACLLWLFEKDVRNPLEIDGYFTDLPTPEEAVRKLRETRKG